MCHTLQIREHLEKGGVPEAEARIHAYAHQDVLEGNLDALKVKEYLEKLGVPEAQAMAHAKAYQATYQSIHRKAHHQTL